MKLFDIRSVLFDGFSGFSQNRFSKVSLKFSKVLAVQYFSMQDPKKSGYIVSYSKAKNNQNKNQIYFDLPVKHLFQMDDFKSICHK